MNQPSKVLLIVTAAGIVLGAGLSRYVSPSMKFAAEPDWRDRYRPTYSDTSMQFVDTGPIDLAPSMPWLGATGQPDEPPYSHYQADYLSDEDLYGTDEPLALNDFAEPALPPDPVDQAVVQATETAAQLEAGGGQAERPNHMVSQYSFEPAEPAHPSGSTHAL